MEAKIDAFPAERCNVVVAALSNFHDATTASDDDDRASVTDETLSSGGISLQMDDDGRSVLRPANPLPSLVTLGSSE